MASISKRFGAEAAETLANMLSGDPSAISDQRALFARDVTPEKRRVDEASPELVSALVSIDTNSRK
jgi:hypothetical protein